MVDLVDTEVWRRSGSGNRPQPAECCSEFLEDEHTDQPLKKRARQFRHLGAVCLGTFVGGILAVMLAAHFASEPKPAPKAVPSLGVWA